jgi:primosomal protein N'
MFVIEVIPLIRGTTIDTLSYYSATSYPVGTIVSVPIRKKLTRALVTEVHTVSDAKSTLRNAAFTLKKLPPQNNLVVVPDTVRTLAESLTSIYPCSAGALLFQLLPPEVRDGSYLYPGVSTLINHEETTPRVLTATSAERFVSYRSHIRSVLARRGSVLYIAPTSADLVKAEHTLTQGIEDRVVIFSAHQTPKQRQAAYAAFEDTSVAKLILSTPAHAYLDRVDLLSMIIDHEASDYYRSRTRPYIDHRVALITLAKQTGRSILLGDILPQPDTEYKRRLDLYSTEGAETKRLSFTAPLSIIEQKDKPTPESPFSLISKELRKDIENTLTGRGRVFLYGARRGIAPVVACIDCGHIFRCPDSGTPYSLLRSVGKDGTEVRWFVSSVSGKRVRAPHTCPICTSWRLRERGIGIQSAFDEVRNLFPNHPVLLFDHQTASTPKKAEAIMAEFYAARGAILVGTQMVLPYIAMTGVDISAVLSLDAARANPTWRADEHMLHLLFSLRERSHKGVYLQTRTAPDQLLSYASSGILEGFYTEELALRESLSYPPFTTFILLSFEGDQPMIDKTEAEIEKRTNTFNPTFYSNPLSTKAKTLRYCLFRIKNGDKTIATLVDTIRAFPPYIKVEVNPNRIV